jgi:hypothetical protein
VSFTDARARGGYFDPTILIAVENSYGSDETAFKADAEKLFTSWGSEGLGGLFRVCCVEPQYYQSIERSNQSDLISRRTEILAFTIADGGFHKDGERYE